MFQAVPFLYSGKEWIDRYHGEDQEDNEDFQEVLEMAEESKDKIVQGVIKYLESKNKFEKLQLQNWGKGLILKEPMITFNGSVNPEMVLENKMGV